MLFGGDCQEDVRGKNRQGLGLKRPGAGRLRGYFGS